MSPTERPTRLSSPRRQPSFSQVVGLLLPLLMLGGCSGSDTLEAGSTSAPPIAEPTPAPPTAEPLPDRTVAVDEEGERASATPVEPTETAAADDDGDVLVQLADVDYVVGEAQIPGEVEGPAVRVTIEVVNQSAEALDVSASVVNLAYGADQTPANTFQRPGGRPMPAQVEAGGAATGVYLFAVPLDERDDVRIVVDIAPELKVVVFEGELAR